MSIYKEPSRIDLWEELELLQTTMSSVPLANFGAGFSRQRTLEHSRSNLFLAATACKDFVGS
eukprot:2738892-Amphidinium_carterae.1